MQGTKIGQLIGWLKDQTNYATGFQTWPSSRATWAEFVRPFDGVPPLKLRLLEDRLEDGQEPLFLLQIPLRYAAEDGRVDIIDFFFTDLGVNVLHYDWINNIPSWAMDYGQWEVAKYFRDVWNFDPTNVCEIDPDHSKDTVMEQQCYWANWARCKTYYPGITPLVSTLIEYQMDL